MSHFEFTGETKSTPTGVVLHRIRATKPLPRFDVRVGDVGGWIESESNLSGAAWVSGNAWVYGGARVCGNARVSGDAQVSGNAWVYAWAVVSGNAQVSGNAWVYGNAWVTEIQHVLSVGPLGSESVTATAFRDTTGHLLHVGCWRGTVDELAAEVERRAKNWQCDEPTAARWRAEYAALETLVRARITGWEASA